MTRGKSREHAQMRLGIGIALGVIAYLLLNNIAIGVAIGLVFALTLKSD